MYNPTGTRTPLCAYLKNVDDTTTVYVAIENTGDLVIEATKAQIRELCPTVYNAEVYLYDDSSARIYVQI